MPRAIKETSITIGFVQVPVSLFKAGQDSDLDLRSLCECGRPPRQVIVCENPNCGTPVRDVQEAIERGDTVRSGPNGVFAARRFPSWQATPKRGYEWTKGKYVEVSADEIKAARAEGKVDSFEVAKTVDLKAVAVRYVLGDPLYLLPPEDANKVAKQAYSLIVEALDQKGLSLLAYLSLRDKTHRYSIVSGMGFLMAYQLQERRPLPYTPEKEPVQDKQKEQVQAILQGVYAEDATIEAAPDPVMALLEGKIRDLVEETLAAGEQAVLTTK